MIRPDKRLEKRLAEIYRVKLRKNKENSNGKISKIGRSAVGFMKDQAIDKAIEEPLAAMGIKGLLRGRRTHRRGRTLMYDNRNKSKLKDQNRRFFGLLPAKEETWMRKERKKREAEEKKEREKQHKKAARQAKKVKREQEKQRNRTALQAKRDKRHQEKLRRKR